MGHSVPCRGGVGGGLSGIGVIGCMILTWSYNAPSYNGFSSSVSGIFEYLLFNVNLHAIML